MVHIYSTSAHQVTIEILTTLGNKQKQRTVSYLFADHELGGRHHGDHHWEEPLEHCVAHRGGDRGVLRGRRAVAGAVMEA